jgi:RES domain-containing protein
MLSWRIEYAQHLEDTLSGEGARRYGGRWNEKGTAVIYLSSHLSLAALEKFVHAVPEGPGIALHAVAVEIASDLVNRAHRPTPLPAAWNSVEPATGSMEWGTQWARSRQSLVAAVPSALLPLSCFEHSREFNLMLNPEHEDMNRIRVRERPVFSFDSCMWKTSR